MTFYPQHDLQAWVRDRLKTVGRIRRQATSRVQRLLRITLGTTALGLVLSVTGIVSAGQHSESAPHRCAGCANGTCQPRVSTYGHYQAHWRRWPGATTYEGFRKRKPDVAVPDALVPEVIDEMRVSKRTRSDRPLDPEPGNFEGEGINFGASSGADNVPDGTLPGSGGGADPSDPFQVVPNSDLPLPGGGEGGFDAGGAGGGFDGGALEPANNPPPAGDLFGPSDTGSESLPGTDDLFGPTSGLTPPINSMLGNVGAIRAIKNRRISRPNSSNKQVTSTNQHQTTEDKLAAAGLIPSVTGAKLDVPQIDTVGGTFGNGEFTVDDLRSPSTSAPETEPVPPTETRILLEQVSFEEPTTAAGSSAPAPKTGIVSAVSVVDAPALPNPQQPEHTKTKSRNLAAPVAEKTLTEEVLVLPNGNPLRAQRRTIKTSIPKAPEESPTLSPSVQEQSIELKPVPRVKVQPLASSKNLPMTPPTVVTPLSMSSPAKDVATLQTASTERLSAKIEFKPLKAVKPKPVPSTKKTADARSLSMLQSRSLRDTLRKNPLR